MWDARGLGRRTLVTSADVRDEAQVQAMVARAVETFGRIDVLVNCAGTTGPVETPVQEIRVGDWDDLLAINLSSNDYVGHRFGPDSAEVLDCSVRTDRQLAEFLQGLAARFPDGLARVVVAVSADHGVAPKSAQ